MRLTGAMPYRRGERGSALVMALVFLTVLGVLVSSIVSFAGAALKAGTTFKDRRDRTFAADGAVEAAINRFRLQNPCDDFPAPRAPGGEPVANHDLIVRCRNVSAEGDLNKPAQALLALGTNPNEGIVSTTPGQRIRGDVFSHSRVRSDVGTMVVEGGVSALGPCTNVATDTDPPSPLRCTNTPPLVADPVRGADPDYTKDLTSVPVRRTVPPCVPGEWLITLDPGYYDDADALSARTNGGCPNAVVWLRSGVYYFNFSFQDGAAATWTISDPTVNVVAGEPKTAFDPGAARPTLPVPGSCKVQGDPPPVGGVQVIIGGTTNIDVSGGARAEFCAEPSTEQQQIALYGIGPDHPHVLRPTGTEVPSAFVNAADALLIGEVPVCTPDPCDPPPDPPVASARATLDESNDTVSLKLTGYRPAIPAGSVIDSAVLRVAHREDGDIATVDATVEYDGDTCDVPLSLRNLGAVAEDSRDLKAFCSLDEDAPLENLSVTYTADLGDGAAGTAYLDGAWIDVSYRSALSRKPTVSTASPVGIFNQPGNAFEIGEQPEVLTADAALAEGGTTTASLTLQGFDRPRIPPGSVIDSAVVRVAHHDEGAVAAVQLTANLGDGGTLTFHSADSPCELCLHADGQAEDRIEVPNLSVAQLNGLTLTFEATVDSATGSTATERLDGIWLDIVYAPPLTRTPITAASAEYANPDDAKVIGETPAPLTADANLDAGGTATGTLAVGNFSLPIVPAGSLIDSAVLRVAHRGDAGITSKSAKPTFTGDTCPTQPLTPSAPSILEQKLIDLTDCGLSDPAQLTGLTVTYTATVATGTALDRLDGIVLDLTYRPPVTYSPDTAAPFTAYVPNADASREIDDTAATAPLVDPGTMTASVRLSGYDDVPIQPGSAVDSAVLRIKHREEGDVGSVTATVNRGGAPPITLSSTDPTCKLCLNTSPALVEHRIDLKALGFTDARQLLGLSVDFVANLTPGTGNTGTEHLDGVELDVVFRAPTFEPLGGCVAPSAGAYPTAGCALVKTTATNPVTRLVVQGTVYAPSAALDISMIGVDQQVLTRGLIARTIRLGIASTVDRPTTGVPPEAVTFTAYPRALRKASVHDDPDTSNFSPPQNAFEIDEQPPATADVDLQAQGLTTARIHLKGFDQPALPEGTPSGDAVLRVKHRETGTISSVRVRVLLANGDIHVFHDDATTDDPCDLCINLSGTDLKEDRIELPGLTAAQLLNATVTYEVTGDGTSPATAHLDGIVLEVFSNPLLRARASSDPQGRVAVEGWSVLR